MMCSKMADMDIIKELQNLKDRVEALEAKMKKPKFSKDSTDLLDILNALTGKNFRHVPVNLKLIEERLKSGIPRDDLHAMLGMMCDKWKGTDMDKFLRPATLFGLEKCEGYIGELNRKPTYEGK